MKISMKLILPAVGLLMFGAVSYRDFLRHPTQEGQGRYLYWSFIRLDRNPLRKEPPVTPYVANHPCPNGDPNCTEWDLQSVWIDPGLLDEMLIITALPAFIVGGFLRRGLGHLGISQVTTFMVCMPPLIFAWYYFVAWLAARLWQRIARRRHSMPSVL